MGAFRCEPKNAFEVVKKPTNECQQIFLRDFLTYLKPNSFPLLLLLKSFHFTNYQRTKVNNQPAFRDVKCVLNLHISPDLSLLKIQCRKSIFNIIYMR